MEIVRTATYSLQNTHPKEMAATIAIYRDAVEALAIIVRAEWVSIVACPKLNQREHLVEDLVITTDPRKKCEPKPKDGVVAPPKASAPPSNDTNPVDDGFVFCIVTAPPEKTSGKKAKYPDFEASFGNMPAYLRRSAIRDALGLVASHNTRSDQWATKQAEIVASKRNDKQKKIALAKLGRPPTFQPKTRKTPAMYRGNKRKIQKALGVGRTLENKIAGVRTDAGGILVWISATHAALKLYNGATWGWYCVKIKVPKKNKFPEADGWVEGTPTLVPTRGTFEIHIAMKKKMLLTVKGSGKPVLSVDLGLNTRATVAVVTPDGTILDRAFINCSQNTGSLEHLLGKIAQSYKLSGQPVKGRGTCRDRWKQVANLTDEIAHSVSAELVKMAKEHDCEAIVFEHLGKMKMPRCFYGAKRLRKKLHYWMQGRIQRYTEQKSHAVGIRYSRVLARGTSAEAFDGSGPVQRSGSCKIAKFKNGRIYDAYLSAAYNIAARYWIRELHEKFPKAKTEAAKEVAEVPSQVPDGATVVGAVDQPSKTRRKAKATRGNAVVAGQGITCPVSGSDVKVFVTGVPVSRISRHSLRSLV